MTTPLDDDALHRLLAGPTVPGPASMMHPVELRVPVSLVRALCRRSLRQLRAKREGAPQDSLRGKSDAAEQQLVDFLGWLQPLGDPELRLSVYPTERDGFDDLGDLGLSDDLPF